MTYNLKELQKVGFRLRKVRKEIEGMELRLEGLPAFDIVLAGKITGKKREYMALTAAYEALLAKGIRER